MAKGDRNTIQQIQQNRGIKRVTTQHRDSKRKVRQDTGVDVGCHLCLLALAPLI